MNTIWQFQIFESVYMLTGGGPLKSTETVIYSIYLFSFKYNRMSIGAAGSVLFLFFILIVCGLEMLLFRLSADRKGGGE
jgi:multiple sugar transport system permease protein/sn-glycerol 3-phosphate transport system permease protein